MHATRKFAKSTKDIVLKPEILYLKNISRTKNAVNTILAQKNKIKNKENIFFRSIEVWQILINKMYCFWKVPR